jgi:arylsulfate sulfotransferase
VDKLSGPIKITFLGSGGGAAAVPALTVTQKAANSTTGPSNRAELVTFIPDAGTVSTLKVFVTDIDGNPIWYYAPADGNPSFMKLLPNGNFLICIGISNGSSVIREVNLTGKTIRELDAGSLQNKIQGSGHNPKFLAFHHDFAPLDNGHVIVLGQTSRDFTDLPGYPGTMTVVGDVLVDLDQDWNPVWVWDSFDYLDVNRHLQGLPDCLELHPVAFLT